jgi:hypothetical protein
MDENNILGIVALVVSIGGVVLGIINHKRIRSKCGEQVIEASIDIENTTPELKIKTPEKNNIE